LEILQKYISDENVINVLKEIIFSFNSGKIGTGLPLGNLTSQLFANVYMNEFDNFAKHKLKEKHYIRYADDFIILSKDKKHIESLIEIINNFLKNRLKLIMHSDKIFIKILFSGVDFLGWINFPDHRVLRTATKRRIFKNINKDLNIKTLASYLGLIKHGNTYKIKNKILKLYIKDSK